jgi:crotonobetainyl-CoA:carnitine CoA-transferase CaiB-like acyl-CoA transferase
MGLSIAIRDEFADPRIRVQRRTELDALLEPIFLTASSQHWLDLLERHDILCGRIHTYNTLFEDSHIQSLDILDPGSVPATVKSPVRFVRDTDWHVPGNAPELGDETGMVLDSFAQTATSSH